jgi:hypothetical protein
MANEYNAQNVGVGKPRLTGSVFRAPLGTTTPTDATSELDSDFKSMGYSSEDGLTNSNERESEEIKAWGGQVVASPQTSVKDTFKLTLIEVLNGDVLEAVYGDNSVSGDLTTGLALAVGMDEPDPSVWVFDMVVNRTLKRVVLPNAKVTELGDIVYKDDEVIGYEVTLTALPDTNGKSHYEYMVDEADVSE